MTDTTKLQTTIADAQAQVKVLVEGEVKAGRFGNLRRLGQVFTSLERAAARLTPPVKSTRKKGTK